MRIQIKKELDRIKAKSKDGVLDPKAVITAARDAKNPLHGCFTWGVRKAALKNLLHEARQLISQYTVTVTTTKGEQIKVRHYVSLTTDRAHGGGYRMLDDVMDDEQMREQMLDDALAELQIFQAKYSRLKQLQPVFDAIEQVVIPARRRNGKRAEARAH